MPQNKKCLASSGAIDEAARLRMCKDSSIAGTFETGTDSPANGKISLATSLRSDWISKLTR